MAGIDLPNPFDFLRNPFSEEYKQALNELVDRANDYWTLREAIAEKIWEAPYAPGLTRFRGIITSFVETTTFKWDYQIKMAVPNDAGDWAAHPNPAALSGTAKNRVEWQNDGVGEEGYGGSVSAPGATVLILPIRVNSVVDIEIEITTEGGAAYWFSASNGISVACA